MNKRDSFVLKGIAILMMIYLHASVSDFMNLIRACDPVPFFLIISGYGLTIWRDKPFSCRLVGCLRLLSRFWLVLTVFLLAGLIINPSAYCNSILEVFYNYSSWQTSYNGECWFLFPYLCLALGSPYLIKFIERNKPVFVLLITSSLYFSTLLCLKFWGSSYIYNQQSLFHLLRFIQFLLPFSLGSLAFFHQWFERLSAKLTCQLLNVCLLLLLVFVRCQLLVNYLDSFYSFGFIILFLSISRKNIIDNILHFLGRYSSYMWFIHSWFCYYLFRDYLYSLGNPILIYVTLILVSLGVSLLLDRLYTIAKRILSIGLHRIIQYSYNR